MEDALDPLEANNRRTVKTELKPVIKDIVRTKFCDRVSTFLVDRIQVASFVVDGEEVQTYRMWLSDGHKSIQGTGHILRFRNRGPWQLFADPHSALTRRELHPFINAGEIQEGSFVSATKYHLASGEKVGGNGSVW